MTLNRDNSNENFNFAERNDQIRFKAIPSIIKIEISKIYSNMISKPLMNPIDISIGKLKVTDSHRKS